MRKWTFIFFLFLALISTLFLPSVADAVDHQQVQLMLNGSIEAPEVPPRITNERTLVPLRFISENIGAHVEWYPQTKEISIMKGDSKLELQLGNEEIVVNGRTEQMDIAPYVDQDRTLVPIRFVSQYLGLHVGWEEEQRIVIVSEPIQVYVNGQPLTRPNSTMHYHQQVYLPIFELADMLHVQVEELKEAQTYAFTLSRNSGSIKENSVHISSDQGNRNGQETVFLPASEVITIDGVKMASFEWVDPLLGTNSKWDLENNIVFIQSVEANEQGDNRNDDFNHLPNDDFYYLPQVQNVLTEDNRFVLELSDANIQYEQFHLSNPRRFVLDLPHTVLAEGLKTEPGTGATVIPVQQELVEQIRISSFSQSPHTVRVVFDLNQRAEVTIQQVDNQLQVLFEKRVPLIVIDPGHGGKDPGASGKNSTESKVVLDVALKLIEHLENDPNLKVVATRTDDTYPTLDERVQLANQIGADLFLSIHANGSTNAAVGGTETFIFYNAENTFGKIVHKHLIGATGLQDRGLKEAGFKVLRETNMPAVLIEMAFISNQYEETLLNDPAFQDKVALAMYNAIKEYEFGK